MPIFPEGTDILTNYETAATNSSPTTTNVMDIEQPKHLISITSNDGQGEIKKQKIKSTKK